MVFHPVQYKQVTGSVYKKKIQLFLNLKTNIGITEVLVFFKAKKYGINNEKEGPYLDH